MNELKDGDGDDEKAITELHLIENIKRTQISEFHTITHAQCAYCNVAHTQQHSSTLICARTEICALRMRYSTTRCCLSLTAHVLPACARKLSQRLQQPIPFTFKFISMLSVCTKILTFIWGHRLNFHDLYQNYTHIALAKAPSISAYTRALACENNKNIKFNMNLRTIETVAVVVVVVEINRLHSNKLSHTRRKCKCASIGNALIGLGWFDLIWCVAQFAS